MRPPRRTSWRPLPPYYGPPADPEATRRSPVGAGRRRRLSGLERLAVGVAPVAERVAPWHRQPRPLGLLCLTAIRVRLGRDNLIDARVALGARAPAEPRPAPRRDAPADARGADGLGADATFARASVSAAPFGRNVPRFGAVDDREITAGPSPRVVSRRLLARRRGPDGVPEPTRTAGFLNLLAASWIQFMVHDWVGHGAEVEPALEVPLADDDREGAPDGWRHPAHEAGGRRFLRIGRTRPWRAGPDGTPVTYAGGLRAYRNSEAHWWDGSQIYGSTPERQHELRTHSGGELRIQDDGRLCVELDRRGEPEDATPPVLELTGVNQNVWVGLSLMHSLLVMEHNAVCRMLRTWYPYRAADDEWLFQTARLIVAAVMARIHTVEWTPALLPNPTATAALRANWYGLAGPRLAARLRRRTSSRYLAGIPGSRREDWGVPHAMTEEFVSIYRMHPLVPDEIRLHSVPAPGARHGAGAPVGLGDLLEPRHRDVIESRDLADLVYSLAVGRPGLLTLHNYPDALRELDRMVHPERSLDPDPDAIGERRRVDLAMIDVMRDRERGVPRYLDFRAGLGLSVPETFEEITGAGDERERAIRGRLGRARVLRRTERVAALTRELAAERTRRIEAARLAGELRAVYGRPERVDLMVGLYAEPLLPGFGFSETAFTLFSIMASRRLMCDRFLTDDYRPEIYTEAGLAWIEATSMSALIGRHLPALAPLTDRVKNAFAPWDAPWNRHDRGEGFPAE